MNVQRAIAWISVVVVSLALGACETTGDRVGGGGDGDTVTIRYVVDGQGRAQVTFGNIGSTNQKTVSLPWSQADELDATFDAASLLAQRQSGGGGTIRCSIENADGEVLESSSASGAYAICDVATG